MRRVFITGTGGFIGYHLARRLLDEGFRVGGYDGMTDYYDVALKRRRHQLLRDHGAHSLTEAMLEDDAKLWTTIEEFSPEVDRSSRRSSGRAFQPRKSALLHRQQCDRDL